MFGAKPVFALLSVFSEPSDTQLESFSEYSKTAPQLICIPTQQTYLIVPSFAMTSGAQSNPPVLGPMHPLEEISPVLEVQ